MASEYDEELEENETDISVEEFAKKLNLEILHSGGGTMHMATFNINRPGLQLAGYFEHFGKDRVQVLGEMETAYLNQLPPKKRMESVERLFKYDFPCLVVSGGCQPCAKKYGRAVFKSRSRSTMIINELSIFLNELLAPRIVIHGVMLDLYGVGVLMIGKSSVGKSETALELIQRNHRLVADDAVCIKRVSDKLVGSSPSVIRYMMEVRGIGIVDVRQMYGTGAVRFSQPVDMVVKLENWDYEKQYNRLGGETEKYNILGLDVPMYTIPVKSGRNLAAIIEVAARNHRLKDMGYDAIEELEQRRRSKTDGGI